MKVPAARVARAIAEDLWPDIQTQQCFAPGVYWFSSAGHGGCVAIVGTAALSPVAVDVARACEKTAVAVFVDGGPHSRPRTRIWTSIKFEEQALREAAAKHSCTTLVEAWVGEEDCDWACIFHAVPRLIEAARAKLNWGLTIEDVDGCLGRGTPSFAMRSPSR